MSNRGYPNPETYGSVKKYLLPHNQITKIFSFSSIETIQQTMRGCKTIKLSSITLINKQHTSEWIINPNKREVVKPFLQDEDL